MLQANLDQMVLCKEVVRVHIRQEGLERSKRGNQIRDGEKCFMQKKMKCESRDGVEGADLLFLERVPKGRGGRVLGRLTVHNVQTLELTLI